MALRSSDGLSRLFGQAFRRCATANSQVAIQQCRYASTTSTDNDLVPTSFLSASDVSSADVSSFDPVGRSRQRTKRLPPSRYRFRPPRYYRGPLHPHQPLPPSDPASREFRAGPFSLPRLEQTYHATIEPDLMTLSYMHHPPGYRAPKKGPRLRSWEGDSPYFANRQLRGPRGSEVLRLLRKPITFRNVPKIERVTVHCMVKGANAEPAWLDVAKMVIQAITGQRTMTKIMKTNDSSLGIRAGEKLSLTAEMYGEDMHHFLSKCIDVVLPGIKNYRGVKGSSGDSSGNITFGLTEEAVALFPEIEVNYDSYPPKLIPGCHVTVHTSAQTDRDARMLLAAIGLPFYGKLVN